MPSGVLVQVQSRAPSKSLPSGSYFNGLHRATDSEPRGRSPRVHHFPEADAENTCILLLGAAENV